MASLGVARGKKANENTSTTNVINDRDDYLLHKPGAAFNASAVSTCANVGTVPHKLNHEVPIFSVFLSTVGACFNEALCSIVIFLDIPLDILINWFSGGFRVFFAPAGLKPIRIEERSARYRLYSH